MDPLPLERIAAVVKDILRNAGGGLAAGTGSLVETDDGALDARHSENGVRCDAGCHLAGANSSIAGADVAHGALGLAVDAPGADAADALAVG